MVPEVLGFESSEEELHGWVQTKGLKLKDPWPSEMLVHPLCRQAADVTELVDSGVE